MVFQPNYSFKKAERKRAKQSRKEGVATEAAGPAEASKPATSPMLMDHERPADPAPEQHAGN